MAFYCLHNFAPLWNLLIITVHHKINHLLGGAGMVYIFFLTLLLSCKNFPRSSRESQNNQAQLRRGRKTNCLRNVIINGAISWVGFSIQKKNHHHNILQRGSASYMHHFHWYSRHLGCMSLPRWQMRLERCNWVINGVTWCGSKIYLKIVTTKRRKWVRAPHMHVTSTKC